MKTFALSLLLVLVACSPKKEDPAPQTTPKTTTAPVAPKLPEVVKTPELGPLPAGLSKRELADKTVFSLYHNGASAYVDSFFTRGVYDAESPFPSAVKMGASMVAGKLKRELNREVMRGLRDLRSKTFRDYLDSVSIDGGVLFGVIRGEKKRRFHELAFFKPSDLKGFMARVGRGEFGVFQKASWGGAVSRKGMMNYSGKGDIYLHVKDGYVLLATEKSHLKAGMALSMGSFRAATKAAFAVSMSDMRIFWRMVRRPVRHLFGPMARTVQGFIGDLKWVSLVAHQPVNGAYEFTAFERFVASPRSALGKSVVKPKTADQLKRYVSRDAIAFGLDGMDPALPARLVARVTTYFEMLKKRDRRGKYRKPHDYVLKLAGRARTLINGWTGYHAASLRVVKGSFLLSGAATVKDKGKSVALAKEAADLLSGLLPQNLLKVIPPREAREMKAFSRFVAIRRAARRFGKMKGYTFTATIKWGQPMRKALGCSKGDMEMARLILGNRIEISLAPTGDLILFSLGSKGTAAELTRMAKAQGSLPEGYKPREGLAYSGIYGMNIALFFDTLIAQGATFAAVKSHPNLVSAVRHVRDYLKRYAKGSWAHATLGTKNSVLIGNLTFATDCIRIPSVLGYLAYEAERAGLRL